MYEVKAKNLEEAKELYEKHDNKGIRKCQLVSNEVSMEYLWEIHDERQKLLWCYDEEKEIPNEVQTIPDGGAEPETPAEGGQIPVADKPGASEGGG